MFAPADILTIGYNIIKNLQKWIIYRGVGATLYNKKGTKKASNECPRLLLYYK